MVVPLVDTYAKCGSLIESNQVFDALFIQKCGHLGLY